MNQFFFPQSISEAPPMNIRIFLRLTDSFPWLLYLKNTIRDQLPLLFVLETFDKTGEKIEPLRAGTISQMTPLLFPAPKFRATSNSR